MRSVSGYLIALLLLPSTVYGFDTAELFALLAQNPAPELRFIERSQHRLADEAITFEGVLRLDAQSGTFDKEITAPSSVLFRISEDKVSVTRKGRTFTQTLGERPELAGVVAVLKAMLQGEPDRLQESFDSDLSGDNADWKLTLSPRVEAISKRMTNIIVTGAGSRVVQIDTNWKNGDWQEMRLLP